MSRNTSIAEVVAAVAVQYGLSRLLYAATRNAEEREVGEVSAPRRGARRFGTLVPVAASRER